MSLMLMLTGCASSDSYTWPESPDGAADGDAYAAEAMHFRKEMPKRANPRTWEFYYKHCALNGNESHYSKSSYSCSGPY